MSININDETAARKAYINVRYYHNSMNISPDEMGAISAKWENQLSNWDQIGASGQDANEYMISDEEFESSRTAGWNQASRSTGHDGKSDRGKSDFIATTNYAAGGVGLGIGAAATAGVLTSAGGAGATAMGMSGTAGVLSKVSGVISKAFSAMKSVIVWVVAVAAGLLLASAMTLANAKPNKEAAAACDKLATEELPKAQATLLESQTEMDEAAAEVQAKSEEASEANDEANSNMQDKQTEYDMYKARYDELKAKIEAGETLTEEEKAEYKKLGEYMGAVSEDITNTQDETTETVQGLYDEIESVQGKYDYAAETVAETQGKIDFAKGFDEDTRVGAKRIAQSAGLGIAGSAGIVIAGIKCAAMAGWKGFWGIAEGIAAALSIGAGITSGIIFGVEAGKQNKYMQSAANEINVRKQTEEFNANALDNYNNQLNAYDGFKTNVESLELEKPQNEGAPTGPDIPEGEEPKKKTENDKGGKAA